MRDRLALVIACGFGLGKIPVAPGTAGSVLGVAYWWALGLSGSWLAYWLAFAGGVIVAVTCAGRAAALLQKTDPPCVVVDEIAAVPLALAGGQSAWWQPLIGFALFRLFDIWKPAPVRQAQAAAGGWGIVLDDIFAAAYACAGMHAITWVITWVQR